MYIFTMLGAILDDVLWGTGNLQVKGSDISYQIADEAMLRECIVPLCEDCIGWSDEIADNSIGYVADINFSKARSNVWQIESITFTNDYGKSKTYHVDLSDIVSESCAEELYHIMCYQIALMSV